MKRLRSKSVHGLGGLMGKVASLVLLAVAACSPMESDSLPDLGTECFYGCSDGAPGGWDAGSDDKGDSTPDAGDDALPLSPLCGQGSCHPDLPEACSTESASLLQTASEESDEEAPPDDPADAGNDGEPLLPPPSSGEEPPGDDDAGADSGSGTELPHMGCHVWRGPEGPERSCQATGAGDVSAPCITSADCAPGLACVGPKHGGICRPYCCGDAEACPSRTYCDVRELRDEGESPMGIPVCVPAMNCKLLEQEPCASLGLVCGIVRADGTTSCVLPGTGKLDEPCPCAFGYVCAKSQNKCLKLCHVNLASAECPGGTCQGGTGELPPGIGVCVGGYQDAG